MTTVRPGFYKLTCDVKNPTPDRRKSRDWTAEPEWEAGMRIYVRKTHHDDIEIERVGNRYLSISRGQKAFGVILAHIEPIAEDYGCLMHRLGGEDNNASSLLKALHEMHRVSLADIADASRFLDDKYARLDHEGGHHVDRPRNDCPLCVVSAPKGEV